MLISSRKFNGNRVSKGMERSHYLFKALPPSPANIKSSTQARKPLVTAQWSNMRHGVLDEHNDVTGRLGGLVVSI